MIYDRILSVLEIMALQQMTDRSNIDGTTDGIQDIANGQQPTVNNRYFDLQGRNIKSPRKGGLYIRNGKKILVK